MVANRQEITDRSAASRDLLASLLDRGYTSEARIVTRALYNVFEQGPILNRLQQLEEEAARLAARGERFTSDNPYLGTLLYDMRDALNRSRAVIDAAAPGLQQSGANAAARVTREIALPGMDDQALARIGIRWNVPDPEAVLSVVNYTTSQTWQNELERYASGAADSIRNIAIRGIVAGQGPIAIAREIRRAVGTMPAAAANTLMRTLQVTSYRDATVVHQTANSDIITEIVRIAALDTRTCLACVALHGETYPVGTRIDDHHNGRCTSISRVRGQRLNIQSGPDWFAGLPENQQRQMMGHANFEAWRAGRVSLRDFVQEYQDPVFGRMIRESSLRGILGDQEARSFYLRGGSRRSPAGSAPEGQIATINGYVVPDIGSPGMTPEALNTFLLQSNGPLAQNLRDPSMGLTSLDFFTDEYVINRDAVATAARSFLVESQNFEYGREYILSLARDRARENGVFLEGAALERAYNREYAARAQAILTAVDIGSVRITDAQRRRLEQAAAGDYLGVVYSREGSESGSLANAVARRRHSSGLSEAERRELRANFRDWVQGIDD